MSIRIDGTNTTANPGITGTDTDTGLQFGTDEVKVVTGGSDRVTVDSSGNVGIGTTANSDSQLHVKSGANDGNPVLRLEAATNNFLNFRQTGSVYDIRVTAGDPLSFTIGSSEKARVTSDGLTFNGDTAAANALDDYEEGTWTPTAAGGHTGITVDTNNCVYIKVGKMVTLHFEIYYPTGLSGSTFKTGGVPFQIDEEATGTVMLNSVDFPTNRTMVTLYGNNSELRLYASGNGQNWQDLHGNDVTTDASILGTITYRST